MRSMSLTLALALFGAATAGCATTDTDTDTDQGQEVRVKPDNSAWVLNISTDEDGNNVTRAGGVDMCPDFATCNFPELDGAVLSIKARVPRNIPDCEQWHAWTGACAGQGATCTVTIHSDLTVHAVWTFILGCHPQ